MEPQDLPLEEIPVEHQNVPIAHQGLHQFLYSADDEHGVTAPVAAALTNDILPLDEWSVLAANAKVAGVYAVFDRQQHPQYVGYSRNVLLSLNGHVIQFGQDICAFVRVHSVKFPKRTEMEALRDRWITELEIPNDAAQNEGWASTVGEAAVRAMSEADRAAYEAKKLKLRKAMADSDLSKEADVAGDDWSAVIGKQTEETRS